MIVERGTIQRPQDVVVTYLVPYATILVKLCINLVSVSGSMFLASWFSILGNHNLSPLTLETM